MTDNEETTYDLEPTNDFVFKNIFGDDNNKLSLLSLLNAILNGKPVIKDFTFLNTETKAEDKDNKISRLDVEAITDDGTIINVEVQCRVTADLYNRAVVYASDLISQNSKKGNSYGDTKVISIWIIKEKVNYGNIKNRIAPIEDAVVCLRPTAWGDGYEPFVDQMRIIWVQLSKFNDEVKNTISKKLNDWITFFKNPSVVESNDEGMKNAKYLWNKLSSSDQKRAQIRAREKYEMDKKSEIYCAREEGKEEGMKEGLEKGIKEGLEKGIQEGLEKGIQEGEKRKMKELILNMSNQGLDDEFIAKCLNIDINTLKQLLNN